jgi:hypothetical protein
MVGKRRILTLQGAGKFENSSCLECFLATPTVAALGEELFFFLKESMFSLCLFTQECKDSTRIRPRRV